MSPIGILVVALAFLAAGSIVVFTLRVGISPMPSTGRARRAMLAAAATLPPGLVLDLGSGWGHLAIAFARAHPDRCVVGYELSLVPWAVSCLLKKWLRLPNLSFQRADFLQADLSQAAVLLCYLFPRGMQQLAAKLASEGLRPEVLVSNTFALPSVQADEVLRLDDLYRTPIYVYRKVGDRAA